LHISANPSLSLSLFAPDQAIALVLVLLHPVFIIIDHGHFQYALARATP
jgi:hypothetical protein